MTGHGTVHASREEGAEVGIGRAGTHHGEILQGVFSVDGRCVRGLVTLQCTLFQAEVRASLEPGVRTVEVTPAWKVKALTAARLALDALGLDDVGAHLVIRGAIPVCRGFGSSTSDIVAAVRAILSAAGAQMDQAAIAALAVRSEVASDPLMFDRAVLFAQRDGVVLEDFGVPLPSLDVLGFSTSLDGSGVSTLDFPPARYSAGEVNEFERLRLLLRDALAEDDVHAVGVVASTSARLNQRHLPVPQLEALEQQVRDVGALGLQVAHSGDLAGFLFDSSDRDLEERLDKARRLLARLGVAETWRFSSA
ncbi:MAG: kinase [Actinomycetota bacterium]